MNVGFEEVNYVWFCLLPIIGGAVIVTLAWIMGFLDGDE